MKPELGTEEDDLEDVEVDEEAVPIGQKIPKNARIKVKIVVYDQFDRVIDVRFVVKDEEVQKILSRDVTIMDN